MNTAGVLVARLLIVVCPVLFLTGASSRDVHFAAVAQPVSGGTGTLKTGSTRTLTSAPVSTATGSVALSPYAEELIRILKFDRQAIVMSKEITQSSVQRLVGFDENGYQIIAAGIAFAVPEDRTDRILTQLRQKLGPLHYMAFVVEMNAGLKMDKIGILKGTDQYEILRIMQTNGDEYDIANQDVIDRLKEWERCCPLDIIGADNDWVEVEFKTLPQDLKAFAEEVYDFSPDAVEQGPGSVEELVKEIKKTNRLFLWWD